MKKKFQPYSISSTLATTAADIKTGEVIHGPTKDDATNADLNGALLLENSSSETEAAVLPGVVEVALQIAAGRAKILGKMRTAFLANDKEMALELAKQLCGIEDRSDAA